MMLCFVLLSLCGYGVDEMCGVKFGNRCVFGFCDEDRECVVNVEFSFCFRCVCFL